MLKPGKAFQEIHPFHFHNTYDISNQL